MADYNSGLPIPASITDHEANETLPKVLGLVGFAFLFTGVGSIAGVTIGASSFAIAFFGGLCTLFALLVLKEVSPLNLVLLYTFCAFEGILLGPIVGSFVATGHLGIVLQAAAITGVVTMAAGVGGVRTTRDLTALGHLLSLGLLALLAALVISIVVQASILSFAISVAGALLFTGFIFFDLNRAAQAGRLSEGDAIVLAVNIYLDILNLFLYLLRILAALSGDD